MNETCRVMVEGIVRVAESQGIKIGPAELKQIRDTVMAFDKMPMKQKLVVGQRIQERFKANPDEFMQALSDLSESAPDIAPRLAAAVVRDNPFAPD